MSQPLTHLRLLNTTSLPSPITACSNSEQEKNPRLLIALNPAIDLTATAGTNDSAAGAVGGSGNTVLHVWRAGEPGQLVSRVGEKGKKVEGGVRWKGDGQFVAAGWSDGVVRLIGLESSKAVHHIRIGDDNTSSSPAKIEFIAWVRNVTGEAIERRKRRQQASSSKGVPSKLPERTIQLDRDHVSDIVLDLPHELTFLDIETSLPKLSPLPVSGGSGDDMFLFSTTASLEFVFRPCKAEDADDVHIMLVGTADGGIHISIYDSFVIGMLRASPPRGGGNVFKLCGHSAHPEVSTHMLLLRPQDGDGSSLYLVPMDLIFVHHSPINLSLLASKITTLHNLLRYLKQAQSHMMSEWKSTRELPARFMASVQEDLKKVGNGRWTIVQALFHTVATGHVFPVVREWLMDTIGERGYKRWEKAVVSGLVSLRSLVHENFIPALERCGVILSRLLGLAKFHESMKENVGFTEVQISRLIDTVSSLMLVAHKVLTAVMDELDYFNAFATWLKMEIDFQFQPSLADELTERQATINYGKVLTYIQHYLVRSRLAVYFEELAKKEEEQAAKEEASAAVEGAKSLLDLVDRQMKEQEEGKEYMKAVPRVDFLLDYLTKGAKEVFNGIAEAEKQNVRFGEATELSLGAGRRIWRSDVSMVRPDNKDATAVATFTATVWEEDKSRVLLVRTNTSVCDGLSGPVSSTACGLLLPSGLSIIDLKFLDEHSLLLLCEQKDEPESVLIRIAYRPLSSSLPYSAYVPGQWPAAEVTINAPGTKADKGAIARYFGFDHGPKFTPVQMEVQRACRLRGEVPARVCLVAKDRSTYKTYALPEE